MTRTIGLPATLLCLRISSALLPRQYVKQIRKRRTQSSALQKHLLSICVHLRNLRPFRRLAGFTPPRPSRNGAASWISGAPSVVETGHQKVDAPRSSKPPLGPTPEAHGLE